ncbi:MAG: hypothetical protein ACJAT2_002196 [Bacteriovoracaceae bacterium]|jgi:hypothetical protein
MFSKDDEGSLILEKLSEAELIDEFYSAVDSDDFSKIEELLSLAGVSDSSIGSVIKQLVES